MGYASAAGKTDARGWCSAPGERDVLLRRQALLAEEDTP